MHDLAVDLSARLGVSPITAQILLNRGISQPDACTEFLRPSLKLLHDPALLAGLPRAADRIAQAIRDKHKIVIYGDYDVDGITATSILWHAITTLGGVAQTYIPHRIDEGYGLNADAVAQLCADGAQLIITVDCGITAAGPVSVAKDRGVDLIVTDHHEWHTHADTTPDLPDAHTLVHPRLPRDDGTRYPNPNLCGAGVAFKLAWGIGQAVSGASRVSESYKQFLVEATGLAALGTIADVVPLVGENRNLAAFGLAALPKSNLRGVRALIESANLTGRKLDAYDVGFMLAPRLNACGRMGHAELAVEMLTVASGERAVEIATYLEQQNRQRQSTERAMVDQALEMIAQLGLDRDDQRAVVLAHREWHPGVIGIVASRIVDRLHRPTIMIAMGEDIGAGSGRSITGFHLARALSACTDCLESHGGHEMAAGLKIRPAKLESFRAAFADYARSHVTDDMLTPELTIECTTQLRQVTQALVNEMTRLGPFGNGNRRPLLACEGVEVAAPPRRVGQQGNHLQLFLRQNGTHMKGIAFNKGDLADALMPGALVDLAVEPTINEFNGRVNVELEVKDVRVRV